MSTKPAAGHTARRERKSFGEVADEFIAARAAEFRNAKHLAQWQMTLKEYAKPLRRIPVEDVSTDDVVAVLRPIWRDKNETASRLRGRIERVLDYARALELRVGENPARWRGHLDHILGSKIKLARGHHSAMPHATIPAFFSRLHILEGYAAEALRFCILTASRSGEVLGAKWDEIDLVNDVWVVPPDRMKSGRAHEVPLSSSARAILDAQLERRASTFVFPGQDLKGPLSNMAMTSVLRRMGIDVTVHGFRSSFRDWAGDATDFPREVAEMALAHRVGNAVELAYRRGSAFAKRRALMEAWSIYLEGPTADA